MLLDFYIRFFLLLIIFPKIEVYSQTASRVFSAYMLQEKDIPMLPIKNSHWQEISDTKDSLPEFSMKKHVVYRIRYHHEVDSIVFPVGAEIHFSGGSLKGKVIFNNNFLSGKVNLRQSKLFGSIANLQFEAGWSCYGDSIHDDAWNINQILKICNKIHFQKGTYLMTSCHEIPEDFPEKYQKKVLSHIGINKSNIYLSGDDGACIYTNDSIKTICIYSTPNDFEHTIENIKIEGLTFRNVNDGKRFFGLEHTIKVAGVDGLMIRNCQFFDFRGDAICLSHMGNSVKNGELTRNSNVIIEGNYIEGVSHNNRNGISIISGKNVLINDNIIEETGKGNMPGCIDIEANGIPYTMEDISIINNRISGSKKGGICIYSNKKGAPANKIIIANNTITKCRLGIHFVIQSLYTSGDIIVKDNRISECCKPWCFTGSGKSKNWSFLRNEVSGEEIQKIPLRINVENLVVE